MENLKTNWKLPEKTKNPRSPTGNWLQENWKHSENSRKKLKFSLKNCKIGRQGRENSPQSARQKSPTALKRLDISIKRTLKIGHRLRWFCAMQQRKKPVTFFMSQAFGAPEGTRTPDLLIRSQTLYPAELPAHILLAFSPENVFYYSAHRLESQAFFSKNSKNSINGHLSRKSAACGAGFQLFAVVWKRTSNWQILCNIL